MSNSSLSSPSNISINSNNDKTSKSSTSRFYLFPLPNEENSVRSQSFNSLDTDTSTNDQQYSPPNTPTNLNCINSSVAASSASGFGKQIKNNVNKGIGKIQKLFNNNTINNQNILNKRPSNSSVELIRYLSNSSLDSKLSHTNNTLTTENYNNKLKEISSENLRGNQEDDFELTDKFDLSKMDKNQNISQTETAPRFNPSLTGINNVKIIHQPKPPSNYYNDKETQIELNKKLSSLSIKERLEFQQKGYDLLLQQVELKQAQYISLEADISELRAYLVNRNEPVRSAFEIDALKSEIRDLTNEKAKLEFRISKKSNWICKRCTVSNVSESTICGTCMTEREDGQVFICSHCNTINSLFNLSCSNCNSYLAADKHDVPNLLNESLQDNHVLQSSLSGTSSRTNLLTPPINNGGNISPRYGSQPTSAQASSNSFYPISGYNPNYEQPSIPYMPGPNKNKPLSSPIMNGLSPSQSANQISPSQNNRNHRSHSNANN